MKQTKWIYGVKSPVLHFILIVKHYVQFVYKKAEAYPGYLTPGGRGELVNVAPYRNLSPPAPDTHTSHCE